MQVTILVLYFVFSLTSLVFDLNFGGGELTRDLDFSMDAGPPPCCPHYPEGAGGQAQQANQRGLSSLAMKYGATAIAPGGAHFGEVEQAAGELFSVFKNKFHM